MDNTKNYWEEHFEDLPMVLQILTGRLKSHFDLSITPWILKNRIGEAYSKEELIDIVELLDQLNTKLNDKNGEYREMKKD
jgi:hypothetical protein